MLWHSNLPHAPSAELRCAALATWRVLTCAVDLSTVFIRWTHSLLGAEARKSPAVDGVVNRDADGKEMRYPIILTPDEKRIARTVVLAFRQAMLTNAP